MAKKIKKEKQEIENRERAKTRLSLSQFVYEYSERHIFVSKVMLSGLYITATNISEIKKKSIKRKIGTIFQVYKNLGLCQKHGQNTVKINRERLKDFTPQEISEMSVYDFRVNNPPKKVLTKESLQKIASVLSGHKI